MAACSKAIRLFISSTFSDFQWERNVLQEKVFPELGRLCRAHGVDFQAVDLRWGIRADEAFEQKTLAICLREVRRCLDVSPMPNFLILLGERYGWQPLPESILESEFVTIIDCLEKADGAVAGLSSLDAIKLVQAWYRRDYNALPIAFRLQARAQGEPYEHWEKTEQILRHIFRQAVAGLGWKGREADKYFLSATHQEILLGALDSSTARNDIREHVFCFQRRRVGLRPNAGIERSRSFEDVDAQGGQDKDANAHLGDLTRGLRERLGNNFLSYHAFAMQKDEISTHHLDAFAHDALLVLRAVVQSELARLAQYSELEQERLRHQAFQIEKTQGFIGRSDDLSRLFDDSLPPALVVFHGEGGIGKSSLMAQAIALGEDQGWNPIYRFTGLTSGASDGFGLIRSLCGEMALTANLNVQSRNDLAGWSDEFRRLVMALGERAPEKFLLAVDALDQLPPADPARQLAWLPRALPDNIRILLSTIDGEILQFARKLQIPVDFRAVKGLGLEDGSALLADWLKAAGRQLQTAQSDRVLTNFRVTGSPLYLRLASEEARLWTAYDGQNLHSGALASDIELLIRQIFARLSFPQNHGQTMVSKTFGYLVAARNGLTEHELIGVLSADPQLMQQFRADSPQGKNLDRLPFIVWSRLRDDLEPYLSERLADGLPAIGFFHRVFKEVAEACYLGSANLRCDYHAALANYFSQGEHDKNYLSIDGHNAPNRRRLSELPFHLNQSGMSGRMADLLEDATYFAAKLAVGQRYELFSEYLHCYAVLADREELSRRAIKLSRVLASHIIAHATGQDGGLDIEDVHAYLAFRTDTRLYRRVLKDVARQLDAPGNQPLSAPHQLLYLGVRARQGNLWRRDGCLGRAQKLLENILPTLQTFGQSAELSRVVYDLGYIAYLKGDLNVSSRLIEESAEIAKASGNEVGKWISRCVAAYQRWLMDVHADDQFSTAQRFRETLDRAIKVFERRKYDDTTSERWVMNVFAHRFNLAYRIGDKKGAEEIFEILENDPWLKGFGDEISLERYRAKLLILRGDQVAGAEMLELLAHKRLQKSHRDEALAEDFAEAGLAYQLAGNIEKAKMVWGFCREKLKPSYANRYWQKMSLRWERQ